MRRVRLLAIGLVIGAIIGGGVSLASDGSLLSDDSTSGTEVLRCYGGEGCNTTTITERPINCNEWYVGMGRDQLRCTWVERGIEDVTLVSDIGNYITAPLSSVNVTTSRHQYDLRSPWDVEFLPDGSKLVTEDTTTEDGWITHVEDGSKERLMKVQTTNPNAAGLMGLAVHPEYPAEPYIYIYRTLGWTAAFDKTRADQYYLNASIIRFRFEDGQLTDRTPVLANYTQSRYEAGGGLEFGPDGKLYITTGSGAKVAPMQPGTPQGKVLRFSPDGTIPGDNPFNTSAYALGFKNPQGLAWHPATDQLYVTMHGKNRYDEIDRVDAGNNYGWPRYSCDERNQRYHYQFHPTNNTPPVWCTKQWTLAPSQSAFVTDPDHPWYGDLFVASLRGRHVHRYVIEDGTVQRNEVFYRTPRFERFRDIEFWNGTLYAVTDHASEEGTVIELRPAASG